MGSKNLIKLGLTSFIVKTHIHGKIKCPFYLLTLSFWLIINNVHEVTKKWISYKIKALASMFWYACFLLWFWVYWLQDIAGLQFTSRIRCEAPQPNWVACNWLIIIIPVPRPLCMGCIHHLQLPMPKARLSEYWYCRLRIHKSE